MDLPISLQLKAQSLEAALRISRPTETAESIISTATKFYEFLSKE
jgi:hypothetical protein